MICKMEESPYRVWRRAVWTVNGLGILATVMYLRSWMFKMGKSPR